MLVVEPLRIMPVTVPQTRWRGNVSVVRLMGYRKTAPDVKGRVLAEVFWSENNRA
ncbi:hypothetical protein [Pseudomonas sp. 37 R 15]|nr:hypothetical protein [Pseudomonas sp. 37 R 15]